ncbi:MAG TPA: YdeI/OmpD-associated family protein [Candidatus Paceibacterota bacterium]
MKKAVSSGVAHTVPSDLKNALASNQAVFLAWKSLTPLARNEWICWTVSVKKPETRKQHIKRLIQELKAGKRRPCCWAGCPHR